MSAIKKFLELNKINRLTIAVVGDVMVDEYYNVTADRVSPEFPIPVMLSPDGKPSKSLPGGAANVVQQFKHFNVGTTLFGFNDKTTERVIPWIRHGHGWGLGAKPNTWLPNKVKQVPIKKRFYQGDFPLCRLDVEKKNYGMPEETLEAIRQALYKEFAIINPPVVILSDYDKGFFNKTTDIWMKDRISIVDPKKGPLSKWKGCTVIKPNAKEAKELSGCEFWQDQADYFERETGAKAVIITQSGDGVVGKIEGEYFEYRPTHKIKATSVIGAGDCFMAFLAMALGHGFSYLEAIEIAFHAGSIYVQNKHNPTLSPLDFAIKHNLDCSNKVVVADELKGDGLVFTNGVFDILHPSHIALLKFAKSQGKQLVVALNSDASVKRLKGENRPINTLADRIAMLAAYDFVDYVTWFDEDTPAEVIQKIMPNKIVKGGDYRPETVVGHEIVGIENVVIFPYQDGYSTTNIVDRIKWIREEHVLESGYLTVPYVPLTQT